MTPFVAVRDPGLVSELPQTLKGPLMTSLARWLYDFHGCDLAAPDRRLQVTTMKKKRCMCMIEPDQLDRMRSVRVASGLSVPDQIRLGIQFWLASREWPARRRSKTSVSPGRALDQGGF